MTDLPPDEEVVVRLVLRVPPGSATPACIIRAEAVETRVAELSTRERLVRADGKISSDGTLNLEIVAHGEFGRPDARHIYIGLTALAYCSVGDIPGRMGLLEKMTCWQAARADTA